MAGYRTVVVGKGGVGKSTLVALLAHALGGRGWRVLAVDADEQMNLGVTLGLDHDAAMRLIPIAEHDDYLEEKTGARPGGGSGAMLRLNPDVTDVVERLGVPAGHGVTLLVMGTVGRAGGGCLCPQHSLLAAVVSGMRLRDDDVVLMDTHAGVEHFGRALARGFDQALVLVDPTYNSVQVGIRSAQLAHELGIGTIRLVINRARRDGDAQRVLAHAERLGGFTFASVHTLPYDEAALEAGSSVGALPAQSVLAGAVRELAGALVPISQQDTPVRA